ncbi:hypothetical protein VZ94_10130 [Methylocucumis oryzae]|uniref:Pentapeptide repeat-containing protein n=2 Tax=Methylocucumis oryzae TaxID=1632867 RepID=A0A0F3IJB0_9GAMM|nr:hypothetical protein VZ94_10130 [Methylocucumis oryzae]
MDDIANKDLIFKGKVEHIDTLFMGKLAKDNQWSTLLKLAWGYPRWAKLLKQAGDRIKPTEYNQWLASEFWEETRYRVKYKVVTAYKAPKLDVIEVETGGKTEGRAIGQEEMVFAKGNIKSGYETKRRCFAFSYFWRTDMGDLSYQKVLDSYWLKQQQLASALGLSPHNPRLLYEQGQLYLQYRDLDAAEWSFRELAWYHPNDIAVKVGLTQVDFYRSLTKTDELSKKQGYEQALAEFNAILRIAPNNKEARHGQTLALLYLGRTTEVAKNAKDFSEFDDSYKVNESINLKNFFAGRRLAGANFNRAHLYQFNFTKADLRNANFVGAFIEYCNFTAANLANAKFTGLTNFEDLPSEKNNFTKANLRHADFSHASLSRFDFSQADLTGTNFSNANLVDCKFDNSLAR